MKSIDKKLKILCAFQGMNEMRLDMLQQKSEIKNDEQFQIAVDELALRHYIAEGSDTFHVKLYTCSAVSRYKKEKRMKKLSILVHSIELIAAVLAAVFGAIQIF